MSVKDHDDIVRIEHDATAKARKALLVDGEGNTTSASILGKYAISNIDADASPNYYGFEEVGGAWYILKETVSAGADTYLYASGSSDLATNWSNRASLTYDIFSAVF